MLRYVVAGDGTAGSVRHARLSPLGPRDGAVVSTDAAVRLAWSADRQASFYRIEVQDAGGVLVHRALVPAAQRRYDLPGAKVAGASGGVRWRVWALDGDGKLLRRTPWRTLRASP
ncbi:MAG: hypothetical protein IPK85_01080 [Gemmatimonadetes bacterium]|nr:hypothetical protein [Gemmatimonadota bacterium]